MLPDNHKCECKSECAERPVDRAGSCTGRYIAFGRNENDMGHNVILQQNDNESSVTAARLVGLLPSMTSHIRAALAPQPSYVSVHR